MHDLKVTAGNCLWIDLKERDWERRGIASEPWRLERDATARERRRGREVDECSTASLAAAIS
jgi:hypothetical protein